jgi:uncharacterized protein (TIGR02444 family)
LNSHELTSSQTLWNFALAFYAQPQIAETCLRLQDEYKANVCLLIAMCWLDARQHQLADEELMALRNHIRGWTQEVVEPLRYLRRRLKSPFEVLPQDETQMELRNILKQAELLAEKKLLIEIERWISVNSQVTSAKAQGKNIERYASELNVPEDLVALIGL